MKEYIEKQELQDMLHDIYEHNLYCLEDYCEKEEKGFSCEDCLYRTIRKDVEALPALTETELPEIMQQLYKKQGAVQFATKLKERAGADEDYGLIVSEKMIDNLLNEMGVL